MFLLDDILLAPIKGLKFVAEKVHEAAEEHVQNEKQTLRTELNDLYMQLDIGEISEEEFDRREDEILDRLDELEEVEEGIRDS